MEPPPPPTFEQLDVLWPHTVPQVRALPARSPFTPMTGNEKNKRRQKAAKEAGDIGRLQELKAKICRSKRDKKKACEG